MNNLRSAARASCAIALLGCSSQSIDDPGGGAAAAGTTGMAGAMGIAGTAGANGTAAPAAIEQATLVDVYTPNAKAPLSATALAFNPMVEGELWV
ncbi:MAG TPA: hypothetical protein VNG33_19395, partial [Polyangiaceae bacterium]|nr:hypothetical protein [Polyangiaceae bacterium]